MRYERELQTAIRAVRDGFSLASAAQAGLTKSDTAVKGDASPVTAADFAVQAVVNHALVEEFDYPIMAEESAGRLQGRPSLLERVRELASPYRGEMLDCGTLTDAVDLGDTPAELVRRPRPGGRRPTRTRRSGVRAHARRGCPVPASADPPP